MRTLAFALLAAAGLFAAGFCNATDLTFVGPFPAATSDPSVVVDAAGTHIYGALALEVNGVWYRGKTQYTLIGIPSSGHRLYQSSVTTLQAENGAHLTVMVEMLMVSIYNERYTQTTYTVISGDIVL